MYVLYWTPGVKRVIEIVVIDDMASKYQRCNRK